MPTKLIQSDATAANHSIAGRILQIRQLQEELRSRPVTGKFGFLKRFFYKAVRSAFSRQFTINHTMLDLIEKLHREAMRQSEQNAASTVPRSDQPIQAALDSTERCGSAMAHEPPPAAESLFGINAGEITRRMPVILAGNNCLSGVTSWADQLRTALADDPRYDVRTLCIGTQLTGRGDIEVRTLHEAQQAIRSLAPCILVPNYMWSLFLTGFEPGIRCIAVCHADSASEYYLPLSWYEPLISRYIAVSQECDGQIKRHIGHRSTDVRLLPYGVHVPASLERESQTEPVRLIYAGRVTQPQKRVWDFLPLVERLLGLGVRFVFDVYGEGDEFAPLQQILNARVPAAKVRFHPRIPHSAMAEKWLTHDIFVQVSDFEGTSVSMLEAMAHGAAPVVTAASSGIAGVIRPGENGYVVPVGDMAAMGDVIAGLARDPSALMRIGGAAYETARSYSMELYVEKFVRILDEVSNADVTSEATKRYGEFAPLHPLAIQYEQLAKRQAELEALKGRALKGILRSGLNRLRAAKKQSKAEVTSRAA